MEELKENYWRTIAYTRKSKRISPAVKERVEDSWKRFDEDVVRKALRIHIDRYPTYKETYTVGIMRNLQREKDSGKDINKEKKNSFNQAQQCEYDFAALERDLVKN